MTGTINETPVPCLSAEQQVYFHQGYPRPPRDHHDMAQLRHAFGITTAACELAQHRADSGPIRGRFGSARRT